MSKICLLVISNSGCEEKHLLKEEINSQISDAGYATFFQLGYYEPLLNHYSKNTLICSIADNNSFDNCEMLWLPDNCSLNGRENTSLFFDRMSALSNSFSHIIKHTGQLELFVGYSGSEYEDFTHIRIKCSEFAHIADCYLNDATAFMDLHIVITA